MKRHTLCIIITLLYSICNLYASSSNEEEPPHSGNFSLPLSQQPSPLISFGENILKKNEAQLFLLPNYLKALKQHYTNLSPSLLYGLSDKASLFLTFPVAIDYVDAIHRSSGYTDTSIQGEYAFYNKDNSRHSDQATIVGELTLPTGSFRKDPITGQGTAGYFIGGTYNRTLVDWMFFTSPGIKILKPYPSAPFSTQYLYQVGLGRNIKSTPDQSIWFVMFEIDGQYSNNNLQFNNLPNNSGGNIVTATPSLWYSTPRFLIQIGLSMPIAQVVKNEQNKLDYFAVINAAWKL